MTEVDVWEPPAVASPGDGGLGLAFRFTRAAVRTLLPPGFPGAYILLRTRMGSDATPIYVGRSDTCLQKRLTEHPYRGRATHFVFASTGNAKRAFWLEAAWYHRLTSENVTLLNQLHPASPANSQLNCPFCANTALESAFRHALAYIPRQGDELQ